MTVGEVILRDSKTPWADFKARMKVGTLVTMLLLIFGWGHIQYIDVSDDRWFRDLMHQTPFRDVVIKEMEITEFAMTVSGEMFKIRDCHLLTEPILQVVKDGMVKEASFVRMAPRPLPINWAVSALPQEFGPWVVTSPISWPDQVFVYITHRCGNDYQTNLFFEQTWGMP